MTSAARPVYVHLPIDLELEVAHTVTPQTLVTTLGAHPDAKAAIVQSPSYYGIAAEQISSYPPGIPILVSGKRITEPIVDFLQRGLAAGMLVPGHPRYDEQCEHDRISCLANKQEEQQHSFLRYL